MEIGMTLVLSIKNKAERSEDATYTKLIDELRNKLSILADKIKPKVYEYEFLKE